MLCTTWTKKACMVTFHTICDGCFFFSFLNKDCKHWRVSSVHINARLQVGVITDDCMASQRQQSEQQMQVVLEHIQDGYPGQRRLQSLGAHLSFIYIICIVPAYFWTKDASLPVPKSHNLMRTSCFTAYRKRLKLSRNAFCNS